MWPCTQDTQVFFVCIKNLFKSHPRVHFHSTNIRYILALPHLIYRSYWCYSNRLTTRHPRYRRLPTTKHHSSTQQIEERKFSNKTIQKGFCTQNKYVIDLIHARIINFLSNFIALHYFDMRLFGINKNVLYMSARPYECVRVRCVYVCVIA